MNQLRAGENRVRIWCQRKFNWFSVGFQGSCGPIERAGDLREDLLSHFFMNGVAYNFFSSYKTIRFIVIFKYVVQSHLMKIFHLMKRRRDLVTI